MMFTLAFRAGCLGVASVALAATLARRAPGIAAVGDSQVGRGYRSVKAAFLYNFAKFAEWPALPSARPHRHLRRR